MSEFADTAPGLQPGAERRGRGRPRSFDSEAALDQAVELFWRQGYAATTVADLTDAMGINPPSLYAAFGSKQQLFERAAQRYAETYRHIVESALAHPDLETVVRAFLTGVIEGATQPDHPAGCLTIQGALACRHGDHDVTDLLAAQRRATQAALETRFAQLRAAGLLPAGADPTTLARYFATLAQGLAVQAGAGTTRDELMALIGPAVAAVAATTR
ncbi:TetR/AcrR family transcriptional regulator [Conexibacter sp. CPCC 206217]|uniref:TetR/AcrR family transcriptional regulator n=1 Tax=Conexibacter sp. CPCC 206217 TaxID=3064574 RepID=UPI0027192ABC|nr:TetR/AcrR family transcriptional regulator [Conexibacter sp. CPCC 206217]MDO8212036.1 TetR/AcrR family transcriptional regulator [Conexibacter sp. CPCC 206217]